MSLFHDLRSGSEGGYDILGLLWAWDFRIDRQATTQDIRGRDVSSGEEDSLGDDRIITSTRVILELMIAVVQRCRSAFVRRGWGGF
jgi:hypothetical protein